MVRIAIIDDDKCFSSELKEQILRIDNIFEVFCYENIEEFTAWMHQSIILLLWI